MNQGIKLIKSVYDKANRLPKWQKRLIIISLWIVGTLEMAIITGIFFGYKKAIKK